jgi:hypothetical protein
VVTVGIWNRQGTMDEEFFFWDEFDRRASARRPTRTRREARVFKGVRGMPVARANRSPRRRDARLLR